MTGNEIRFLLGLGFIAMGLWKATRNPIAGCVIAGIGAGLLESM